MTVEILAWRVKGRSDRSKTTFAFVRGGTYAIVLETSGDGSIVHRSRQFNDSLEAEDWLRGRTADGDLWFAPTVIEVEAPPETSITTELPAGAMIHDGPFKEWAENRVLTAVLYEATIQSLRAVTLKFGEPEPAFTR